MNNIKKLLAGGAAAVLMGVGVAGFTGGADATSASSAATTAATTSQASTSAAPTGGADRAAEVPRPP